MPTIDMGSTKMRPADVTAAAPAVAAYTHGVTAATAAPSAAAVTASASASAAPTVAATPSASAATAVAGERQICATNRNPQRTETRGKSQYEKPRHNKPGGKLFTDRTHDVFPSHSFPRQQVFGRTANAIVLSAFRHLRDCDAALHPR